MIKEIIIAARIHQAAMRFMCVHNIPYRMALHYGAWAVINRGNKVTVVPNNPGDAELARISTSILNEIVLAEQRFEFYGDDCAEAMAAAHKILNIRREE
jgi:hypothetical protein